MDNYENNINKVDDDDDEEYFKYKSLMIPDYVAPWDIQKIYHYFDYFNIANVKNVTFYDHLEPEYNAEDKPFYGFAIIEIDTWYNNTGSRNFYETLKNNNCKIVYDDPYYWKLEFNLDCHNVEQSATVCPENEHPQVNNPVEKQEDQDKQNEQNNLEFPNIDNDSDYIHEETDDEDDYYEYYYVKPKKQRTIETRSFAKNKRKTNPENVKTENMTLKELLCKKNKNYLKNNKRKSYKNEWARRLRLKQA